MTSSSFTTNDSWGATHTAGSPIVAGATGNVTKLSVNMVTNSASCEIALYDGATSDSTRLSTGNAFTSTVGWNDVTISNYGVTSGTTYHVMVKCSATWATESHSGSALGVFADSAFASFPPTTLTLQSNSPLTTGVRLWIE